MSDTNAFDITRHRKYLLKSFSKEKFLRANACGVYDQGKCCQVFKLLV